MINPSLEQNKTHVGKERFLSLESGPMPMDFSPFFANNRPIEIDLGCGKGAFTSALALQFPNINFLGIDYADRWLKKGILPEEKAILSNLKYLKTESRQFIAGCPDQSVAVFYLQFPDPWPKRRHRRRSVFDSSFLTELHRVLNPQGVLHLATDDEDYFSGMRKVVAGAESGWRSFRESVNQRLVHETLKTLYEARFQSMGRSIYYLELNK